MSFRDGKPNGGVSFEAMLVVIVILAVLGLLFGLSFWVQRVLG